MYYIIYNVVIVESRTDHPGAPPVASYPAEEIDVSKKMRAKILSLWKKGHNVWEISQITGASESVVMAVVDGRA